MGMAVSSAKDFGKLEFRNQEFTGYSFEACSLSMGLDRRSIFEGCTFRDLTAKKCTIGYPVFVRCRFENLRASREGQLVYWAGFSDCVFKGLIRNLAIGINIMPAPTQDTARARHINRENILLAAQTGTAIDARDAVLEHSSFRGEAIIPFVRCRCGQAVILKAENLFEKLVALGRAETDRTKSDFLLGAGVLPGEHSIIATIQDGVRDRFGEIEDQLCQNGIEVVHYP